MAIKKPLIISAGQVQQVAAADSVVGAAGGIRFQYDSNTTIADPGSGKFRFNIPPATQIAISETDADGNNVASLLAALDDSTNAVHARLYIMVESTGSLFIYNVTGTNTDNGTWDTLNVGEILAGSISNGDYVRIWASYTGNDGSNGSNGSNGADGRNAGLLYTYSTTTTAADPGSGTLRFNNTTLASATALYISETDGDANGIGAYVNAWDDSTSTVKGQILMRHNTNPAKFALFNVTGTLTDNGTWDTLTVANVVSNGTFSNNDPVKLEFIRTGDIGSTGSTGSTGAAGRDAGIKYTFDNGTTDADPGSGKLRFDNATIGSVTKIYINETDGDGNGLANWIASWDDSTNFTDRGQILIVKDGAPQNLIVFTIVAANTDAGSYDKISVTNLVSTGTISNGDTVKVFFARAGDKGNTGNTGAPGQNGVAIQVVSTGGTAAYSKPSGATAVEVILIGAGGGGGGGRRGAVSSTRGGGGGGGGGAFTTGLFNAALFNDGDTITCGTGGTGGAGASTNDTNGSGGVAGTASSFVGTGGAGITLSAGGGGGGGGGTNNTTTGAAGGAGGVGSGGGAGALAGGAGGNGNSNNVSTAGGSTTLSSNTSAAAGGGGGGGFSSTNTNVVGSAGGNSASATFTGGVGGNVGNAGVPGNGGASSGYYWGGAGGGGGFITTTPRTGGSGGAIGAGGGGGSCANNPTTAGTGGAGADGIAIVITYVN